MSFIQSSALDYIYIDWRLFRVSTAASRYIDTSRRVSGELAVRVVRGGRVGLGLLGFTRRRLERHRCASAA